VAVSIVEETKQRFGNLRRAVSKVNSNTDTSDCLRGSRGLLGIANCHHA
jgi:hypothetical protein